MKKLKLNKVDQLIAKQDLYNEKVKSKIKKIQAKCKHKNIQRLSDYDGASGQCRDCNLYNYYIQGTINHIGVLDVVEIA